MNETQLKASGKGSEGAGDWSALCDTVLQKEQLFRAAHIWRDPAFVYLNNPKVACSSTKASLNLAVAERAGIDLSITRMGQVHKRPLNPMLSPRKIGPQAFQEMLNDPAVVKFSFVRDPVGRFCSAYLSKLDPSRPDPSQRSRLFAYLDLPSDRTLSLEDFARLCAADPEIRDLDPHWRLQRAQIWYDTIPFDFIGNQARWAQDFADVTARIFGAPIPVFDTRKAFGRQTPSTRAAQEISGRARRDIEMAYAEDYAMIEEIAARGMDRLDDR